MERLKHIKDQLVAQVENQMGDLKKVDTKELGEVIDMIKDLSETMYYCSVVEAMEDAADKESSNNTYYYMERYLPHYPYRDSDYYRGGRMYYDDKRSAEDAPYSEEEYTMPWRDQREGRSGVSRKMYMESKQTHQDSAKKIQDLENYMRELTNDVMEMIQDASPEEKAVLQKKVNTLATKLQNV